MWLELPSARLSWIVEQNVVTIFSFPNPLSKSEELQPWGYSKILLSFLIRFDSHFWPNQQQQQYLPQFESILDGHLSRHHREYHLQTFDRFRASFPQAFCTITSVSVADRPSLKRNFMGILCSFPPSLTYKENWLYKISYNLYTVEDKQTKLGVWTDVGW
jgi:hypothetical protein